MKTSKIFSTAAAIVAMFGMGTTEAAADMYHAKEVKCYVGVSEEAFGLQKLGVTADSCEIWGGYNDTGNAAYFRCEIDGSEFTVSETNIDVDATKDLVEYGWSNKWKARYATSNSQDLHLVKVKTTSGDGNKYCITTQSEKINCDYQTWAIDNVKVTMTTEGSPVWSDEKGYYTQNVTWDLTLPSTLLKSLIEDVQIYAYYDNDYKNWYYVGQALNKDLKRDKTVAVKLASGHSTVHYAAVAITYPQYRMLSPEGTGWISDATGSNFFPQQNNAKQIAEDDNWDNQTTNGISAIEEPDAAKLVDIYTISGVQVAHQAKLSEASSTLSHGLYIVNGKKMVLGK